MLYPTTWLSRTLITLTLTAALVVGCAAGDPSETDPTSGSGGAGSPASSSQGTGGAGGFGDGGTGGSSLCAVDCSTINTPQCLISVCNEGAYPGPVGTCVVVDDETGNPCDDGLFCTVNDSCDAGVCNGGPPNDCGMTPAQCQAVTCNETAKNCTQQPFGDGDPCTSSDLCQVNSSCQSGVCVGGAVKDCTFAPVPDDCHVSMCNPINGMCTPVPGNDGQTCIDLNDLCSVGNTCSAGSCLGGQPKNCSALTQGCNLGVCDPISGQCTTQAVMNGQLCDDLNACTAGEICSAGNCGGGAAVTVCELTGDGCCPANCTAMNDLDCQCVTTPITTTFVNTSGWDGIMFDVVAKSTLEVKTFAANIDPGMKTIEIYYKVGTFVGFEMNAAAWTLVGSASVNPVMANVDTPIPVPVDVTIPVGQTYAFYIVSTAAGTLSNGVNYIISVPTGSVQTENADIQILGGKGGSTGFGSSTFVDRGFSGTLTYEQCGN